MGYLSAATHSQLTASVGQSLPSLYASTKSVFLSDAPFLAGLPNPLIALAFSSIVAFDHAAYGPNADMTLPGLLGAPTLNCDDYCVLTARLADIIAGSGPSAQAAIVGWNGGAVGNHAQILAKYAGQYLLLDPTIGFIAKDVTLSGLCRGFPPVSGGYRSFFTPFQTSRTNLTSFDIKVRDAVLSGKYVAEDLLYFFPSYSEYLASPGSAHWATPQSWNV